MYQTEATEQLMHPAQAQEQRQEELLEAALIIDQFRITLEEILELTIHHQAAELQLLALQVHLEVADLVLPEEAQDLLEEVEVLEGDSNNIA